MYNYNEVKAQVKGKGWWKAFTWFLFRRRCFDQFMNVIVGRAIGKNLYNYYTRESILRRMFKDEDTAQFLQQIAEKK
jgi:hypothetical protein